MTPATEYLRYVADNPLDFSAFTEKRDSAVAVLLAALEACPDPSLPRDACDLASEEA